jgi:flagellar protein FlaG
MIGKVQDVVSAAAVIGAVTQTSSKPAAGQEENQAAVETYMNSQAAPEQEQLGVQDVVRAQAEAKDAKDEDKQPLDEEDMSQMMKELNELMDRINCNLQFKYHKEVNLFSVKMIDKNTNEVIKEMPPEEMIENMIQAKDWIGAFIDKNA